MRKGKWRTQRKKQTRVSTVGMEEGDDMTRASHVCRFMVLSPKPLVVRGPFRNSPMGPLFGLQKNVNLCN